jgi:type I restriction enzyme S subunit
MPPSQFDTPWEQLRKLPILTPPLEEQRRIADFLNIETGRIDQLIRLRERQVHLIEERCVSALGHAFSKKAYRPTRLKYLLLNRPRYGVLVPQFSDDGVRFIRVNDLLNLQGRADSLSRIPQSLSAQYTRTVTKPGDVLLSVVGTMGRSAVVPAELAGSNVARAVASLRPLPNVPAELLSTWLTTPEFLRQATEATGSDTAQPTLGMEDLANFELAWPMPGRDQDELLAATRRLQEQRNDLVRVFRRQSQLFNERRRALITAAVTGQFDVTTASGRNVTEGVAV